MHRGSSDGTIVVSDATGKSSLKLHVGVKLQVSPSCDHRGEFPNRRGEESASWLACLQRSTSVVRITGPVVRRRKRNSVLVNVCISRTEGRAVSSLDADHSWIAPRNVFCCLLTPANHDATCVDPPSQYSHGRILVEDLGG